MISNIQNILLQRKIHSNSMGTVLVFNCKKVKKETKNNSPFFIRIVIPFDFRGAFHFYTRKKGHQSKLLVEYQLRISLIRKSNVFKIANTLSSTAILFSLCLLNSQFEYFLFFNKITVIDRIHIKRTYD